MGKGGTGQSPGVTRVISQTQGPSWAIGGPGGGVENPRMDFSPERPGAQMESSS